MLQDGLRNRRVAITGARGFIGSALSERLRGHGCRLELVTRQPVSEVSTLTQANWSTSDLTQTKSWSDLLSRNEIVIHLSAQSDLYRAEQNPGENERANVVPVEQMVAAARTAEGPPRTVIMASTVTIVGMAKTIPVDDFTPDNPITVYDACKRRCEALLADAAGAGHLKGCSLRLANVFGFGTRSNNKNRGFLNAMIEKAACGEPITLYGKGDYVRDFVHVDDVVSAFCAAASTPSGLDGAHYLIASGAGHTLREVMEIVVEEAYRLFGHAVPIIETPPPATLHEIERRNFVGDSMRFQSLTGWQCQVDLRTGIRRYLSRLAEFKRA